MGRGVLGFTPRSLSVLAERAGFKVRHVWVRHGRNEWRKERRWTAGKVKSLALMPILILGELLGRGTTVCPECVEGIDALLIRR